MTEPFKITREDVGRIAINRNGCEYEVIAVGIAGACVKDVDNDTLSLHHLDGHEKHQEHNVPLTHWKPRLLKSPDRWWNIYRYSDGTLGSFSHPDYSNAVIHTDATIGIIARIYGPHWHDCEEGRMDEPGKNGVPVDA